MICCFARSNIVPRRDSYLRPSAGNLIRSLPTIIATWPPHTARSPGSERVRVPALQIVAEAGLHLPSLPTHLDPGLLPAFGAGVGLRPTAGRAGITPCG